jgi:hypothetical protein
VLQDCRFLPCLCMMCAVCTMRCAPLACRVQQLPFVCLQRISTSTSRQHLQLPMCHLRLAALQEYSAVYVASQRLEQLLELMANDGDTRPLVVTSRDRLDIVMGLLASQVRTTSFCLLPALGMCLMAGSRAVGAETGVLTQQRSLDRVFPRTWREHLHKCKDAPHSCRNATKACSTVLRRQRMVLGKCRVSLRTCRNALCTCRIPCAQAFPLCKTAGMACAHATQSAHLQDSPCTSSPILCACRNALRTCRKATRSCMTFCTLHRPCSAVRPDQAALCCSLVPCAGFRGRPQHRLHLADACRA